MIASIAPLIRRPMMGRGEAAAKPKREDGRLYCVVASIQITALEAISGSPSSIQYSSVSSRSSRVAWSTMTGWGSEGGCGCGGASAGRINGKAGICWPLEVAAKYLGALI